MPYKDLAQARARSRKYYWEHHAQARASQRRWYEKNAESERERHRIRRAIPSEYPPKARQLAPWMAQRPDLYQGEEVPSPVICKRGHHLDDRNSSFTEGHTGQRCLECQRERNRSRLSNWHRNRHVPS